MNFPDTIQNALKNLYYSLGGNADIVRDMDDPNDIINAMAKLDIGGGGGPVTPVTAGDVSFDPEETYADNTIGGFANDVNEYIENNPIEPFVVTLTPTALDYSGEMDKTVAEITAAYQAGRKIVYKVMMSETQYIYADVTMVCVDGDYTYPSYNAFIIDDGNNLLMEAVTGATDTGTNNAYTTKIYPLTPMSS